MVPLSAIAGGVQLKVQPKYLWIESSCNTSASFDDAFAAHNDNNSCNQRLVASLAAPWNSGDWECNNFRAATVQETSPGGPLVAGPPWYVNGSAASYLCDYSITYPPPLDANYNNYVPNEQFVGFDPACPSNWKSVSYDIDQYHTIKYCTLSYNPPEPALSCKAAKPDGDPIYPESGVQTETWRDYRSASGLLTFERNYRSDGTSFTSVLSHIGFTDFSQPAGVVKYQSCLSLPYKRPPNYTDDSYCFPLMSTGDPQAVLWTDSGRMLSFNVSSTSYTPDGDINDRVWQTHDAQGNLEWLSRREDNSLELYGPNGARLSKTFANGQSVQYTYSDGTTPASVAPWPGLLIAETDTFGRSLKFQYDAGGRMTTMTDPSGQNTTYGYDSTSSDCLTGRCDRLTSVTYPDGYELEYIWNESANTSGLNLPSTMTGVYEDWPATASTPAKRLRFATFKFDGNGVVSTEQANGVYRYSLSNRTANTVTVNDPLGSATVHTYNTYFGRTYTTAISQPAGSGCSASNNGSVYDSNTGNLTQRDDFDSHRACYAYDTSGRNLETTRVEGLSNSATCSSYLPSGSTLVAGSRKTSTQWHPDWRLPTKVAEPGRITTYVYNGQPDPFNSNAAASCAPSTATLPDGKPIAVLCKKVEQATTDTDGSKDFSATLDTKVANRVWTYTYNAYGQVLTAKGPRTDVDDTTTYTYYSDSTSTHTVGDLQSVKNALGQVTNYTSYDANGNVLEVVDANSVATDYTYDARQRLKTVTTSGQKTQYDYWPTGLLKQVTFPDTSYVSYVYDDAHRLTDVTDSLGNTVHYVLDNLGNRTAEQYKDPNGNLKRELDRVIDALGRVQQTTGRE
jgi:YD repeat-containing protein